MKLSIKCLIQHLQQKDKAVAVIIGTILLIAISISFITAYLSYYLPYEGAFNEQTYYTQSEAAFNSLQIKMNSQSLVPGSIITESIPIGVEGIPPFTAFSDTSVSYTNSSTAAKFSMYISFNVTVQTSLSEYKDYTFVEIFNATGVLSSSDQLQYLNNFGYTLTNAMLFRNEGKNSALLSKMGFSAANTSEGYSLFTSMQSLNGSTESVGGYGSAIFQAEYSTINNITLYRGENSSTPDIGLAPGKISNITLLSYSYTANLTFSALLNNYLIGNYNSSAKGNLTWSFFHVFSVNLQGNQLTIHNTKKAQIFLISLDFKVADLLAL
jgi:hypothetical protein